jgi:hypothetical protein
MIKQATQEIRAAQAALTSGVVDAFPQQALPRELNQLAAEYIYEP